MQHALDSAMCHLDYSHANMMRKWAKKLMEMCRRSKKALPSIDEDATELIYTSLKPMCDGYFGKTNLSHYIRKGDRSFAGSHGGAKILAMISRLARNQAN